VTISDDFFFRIPLDERPEKKYQISQSLIQNHCQACSDHDFNPTYVMEDGLGQIWIWSNAFQGATNNRFYRGLWIFKDNKLKHISQLSGIGSCPLSMILPNGKDHVWVSTRGKGIFNVDVRSLETERIEEPHLGAFQFIQKVFDTAEGLYAVTGPLWTNDLEKGMTRYSSLWKLHNGKWKRLIAGMDDYSSTLTPERPWAITPTGLWIGGYGSGGWLIPKNEQLPIHLNWKMNFPLQKMDRMFPLEDRRILVIAFNGGETILDSQSVIEIMYKDSRNKKYEIITTFRELVKGPQGHLWGVPSRDSRIFREWDYETWKEHPRNPQDSPLWKLLNNHYDSFEQGYDARFEKQYGFFRSIISEVVHDY
jgi:hypothetical protein